MSKAFTKEDDDAGFTLDSTSKLLAAPFRLTSTGAKKLGLLQADPTMKALLARAEILPPVTAPERAALGVTVRLRAVASGEERAYRLVSGVERNLLGAGLVREGASEQAGELEGASLRAPSNEKECSVESPLGKALLGAEVGDVRELRAPRGVEELEVIALEGEEPAT